MATHTRTTHRTRPARRTGHRVVVKVSRPTGLTTVSCGECRWTQVFASEGYARKRGAEHARRTSVR